MIAWLGLGSNLRQPVEQLQHAFNRLAESDDIEVLMASSLYQTPPWGDAQQADFVNAVVQIETGLSPLALLHVLQSVEDEMGRRRSDRRWGPRIIDIDLLLYNDYVFHNEELDLPHPRMHERAFVLLPLSELESTLEIPGHGTIGALLTQLDCSGICRLSDADLR